MHPDYSFYRSVDDCRGYLEEYSDVRQWRIDLREKLYYARGRRSDLTQKPLIGGFDMHEGIFERRWVSPNQWQHILFSGINCFLLPDEEHIPDPPDRVLCFWLAVSRYGIENVNRWIASLEFKVRPSTPWRGTNGAKILDEVPSLYRIDKTWQTWFDKVKEKVDIIA